MLRYVCALPNADNSLGTPKGIFSDNDEEIKTFVERHDGPGWGVFECLGKFPPGTTKRNRDTVASLDRVAVDLDFKSVGHPPAEILDTLDKLCLPPSEVHDSGHGFRALWVLKEPLVGEDMARAERAMRRLAELLAGDMAPTSRASLFRLPGSTNTKGGDKRPCRTLPEHSDPARQYDITELEEMLELYGQPLLERKEEEHAAPPANGGRWRRPAPVSEDWLGDMDPTINGDVNEVQTRVIPHLLWRGVHPDDVIKQVVDATMRAAEHHERPWTREVEVKEVTERCKAGVNLLLRDYDPCTGEIPSWLAGDFHEAWTAALAQGRQPQLLRNGHSWYVRAKPEPQEKAEEKTESADTAKARKARVSFRPFTYIDPATLPPRRWLYGGHLQRRIVSADVAPGGVGKTSKALVEAVALATCRNLLGEQPEERCRVWVHNGEDSIEELQRRIVAICEYYDIPQMELEGWLFISSGTEVPLKVANGYNELRIDAGLVTEITSMIADNEIDLFLVDPLVTLHSVPESDNGKMDQVIRIFSKIADVCDCAVNITHHTRKLAAGTTEHTSDDARGASAIRDAVRSLRVLNVMSLSEAAKLGMDEYERLSYFRVDQGKNNTRPPAKRASWYRFEGVTLANGDGVGVVTAWDCPSEASPGITQRADDLFLCVLDRLSVEGQNVSNNPTARNYAPHIFVKEPEAKKARVGKEALGNAMRRLFAAGVIKAEEYTQSGHTRLRIVRAAPETAPKGG
jgi:hypothetical protein